MFLLKHVPQPSHPLDQIWKFLDGQVNLSRIMKPLKGVASFSHQSLTTIHLMQK